MILGILSDTHGQARRAAVAVRLLRRLGAEALVHCGDVCGDDVLFALSGNPPLPTWFVWGNCDSHDPSSAAYAETLGIRAPRDVPTVAEIGPWRIAVFHGHEPQLSRLVRLADARAEAKIAAEFGRLDYVLYGHTHHAADERVGPLRFINPGALQRATTYTVATLDLATGELRHWCVSEAEDAAAPPRRFALAES